MSGRSYRFFQYKKCRLKLVCFLLFFFKNAFSRKKISVFFLAARGKMFFFLVKSCFLRTNVIVLSEEAFGG